MNVTKRPDHLAQMPFDHELDDAAGRVGDHPEAEDDQRDGEDSSLQRELVDLPEADRGQSDHGHVQGIEQRPPLDQGVAKGSAADHRGQDT